MLLRVRIISKYLFLCLCLPCIFLGLSCSGQKNEELERDSNLSVQSPATSGNSTQTGFKADLSQEEVSPPIEEETGKGDEQADDKGSGGEVVEDEAAFRLIVN